MTNFRARYGIDTVVLSSPIEEKIGDDIPSFEKLSGVMRVGALDNTNLPIPSYSNDALVPTAFPAEFGDNQFKEELPSRENRDWELAYSSDVEVLPKMSMESVLGTSEEDSKGLEDNFWGSLPTQTLPNVAGHVVSPIWTWAAEDEVYSLPGYTDREYLSIVDESHKILTGKAPSSARQRDVLLMELEADFNNEPLEDGIDHEAERTLKNALNALQAELVLPWLAEFCTKVSRPNFAASVLRCLGRLSPPGTLTWRSILIEEALQKENVEIRDAAVQAVEQWEDTDLAEILKVHEEEIPWLHDYIQEVISDLKG
jgi:hypothetical protein